MIKNLEELAEGLGSIYPTAYSHFTSKQALPFICYTDEGSSNLFADNKVIAERIGINVELYTAKKDLAAEQKIKQFLNENELPFEQSSTIFLKTEGAFQCIFSIQLDE